MFTPYSQPGSYGITTELWKVRRDGSRIEKIDPLRLGSIPISCNENVAIKRTASFQTDDPGYFKPFVEFVAPYLTISDPAGNTISGQQGLYVIVPSSSTTDSTGRVGTVECRDLCQLLEMATLDNAVCTAGTDRGAFCRQIVLGMGFPPNQVQIPDFGVVQPEDRPWDPGTSVMDILTDMATGSNWYQPWFDNQGRLYTAPYKPLTDVPPVWTYTNANDDEAADIEGAISETPDWTRLANKVTVRKIGDQDQATIFWTAVNANADSPVSTVNIGFEIAKEPVDNPDLLNSDMARVQAEQLLSESASHYVKVSLPTFPVVDAELHQTVGLEIVRGTESVFSGAFWRTGYSLTLDGANTHMVQELSRVEEWK